MFWFTIFEERNEALCKICLKDVVMYNIKCLSNSGKG